MKKIIFSLLACAGLLSSCSMDTPMPGVLDDETAIATPLDAQYFRNGLYNSLRSIGTGAWIYDTELQMDQFIGVNTNGNRGAAFSAGEITTSTGDIGDMWNSLYARIASCNYFIGKTTDLINGGDFDDETLLQLNRYIGEAKFARAYYYFWLMDHWCQTYDPAKGDTPALGIPLVTVYEPTGDTSKYPGRSTMNQTLTLINDDLSDAYAALKAYEDAGNTENCVAGAPYLSTYAVDALRARIAIATCNYEDAVIYSQNVIANTAYQLCPGKELANMWADQETCELIFAPFVNQAESGGISSTCQGWNYWWSAATQSDYIPMSDAVFQFTDNGKVNDYRFGATLAAKAINVQGGQTKTYVFVKYPGNPSLSTGTDMYLNSPKPFRLAEQYLILAEAAANIGQTEVAKAALDHLRENRLYSAYYAPLENLSANALVDLAKEERTKELMGEGFRMSDLRRWKVEWTRNVPYELNDDVDASLSIADRLVHYSADDYRYVWPIPADEMEINPALAGQQNPGY